MKRFTEKKVFSGFTTAWRLAICDGGAGGEPRQRLGGSLTGCYVLPDSVSAWVSARVDGAAARFPTTLTHRVERELARMGHHQLRQLDTQHTLRWMWARMKVNSFFFLSSQL